jgi:hypothetical protein
MSSIFGALILASVIFVRIFFFAILCSHFAGKKNHNRNTWFFVGLFFGLLGLIIVACLPYKYFESDEED